MSYYPTPHQRRLERLLLPWFLVGTLVATHVAISWSERGAVDYRPEPQHWSRMEMPAPPMFR